MSDDICHLCSGAKHRFGVVCPECGGTGQHDNRPQWPMEEAKRSPAGELHIGVRRPNVYRMVSRSPDYPDVLMVGEEDVMERLSVQLRLWLTEMAAGTRAEIRLTSAESICVVKLEKSE